MSKCETDIICFSYDVLFGFSIVQLAEGWSESRLFPEPRLPKLVLWTAISHVSELFNFIACYLVNRQSQDITSTRRQIDTPSIAPWPICAPPMA